MRILFLAEDAGWAGSAYSVCARSLAAELRRRGHEVILGRTREAGRQARAAGARGLDGGPYERVCELGLGRPRWAYPVHAALCVWQVLGMIRRHRVDWVHVHFHGRDRWFWGCARFFTRVPYALIWHSVAPEALGAARRAYLGGMLRASAWVSAVSGSLLRQLISIWPAAAGKGQVVYPGAEHGPAPEAGELRDVPAAVFAAPFLLYVGRIEPHKGICQLLWAFKDLLESAREDINLVLCGSLHQDSAAAWDDLIGRLGLRGRVFRIGVQERAAVSELMRRCLFLVHPAHAESFGLAALEALAHGKPVVASRVGGMVEYIADQENGLLVEPGSSDALARAMQRLCWEPETRLRMGRAAVRTAGRFSWSDAADDYLRLCRQREGGF